jgi:hypothetical protein
MVLPSTTSDGKKTYRALQPGRQLPRSLRHSALAPNMPAGPQLPAQQVDLKMNLAGGHDRFTSASLAPIKAHDSRVR